MASFEKVLQRSDTWRGFHSQRQSGGEKYSLGTGYQALDKALHLGGWPKASLSELYTPQLGIGELSLVLPALASLSSASSPASLSPEALAKAGKQRDTRAIFLINPPHLPYPPMLAMEGINLHQLFVLELKTEQQQLWACTQIMASGHCSACLFWARQPMRQYPVLRKLQLAAQQGNCHGFLFRPCTDLRQHSPASLRLELKPGQQELHLHIHKQRGGQAGQQLSLQRSPLLRSQELLAVPKYYPQPSKAKPFSRPLPTLPAEEKRLWH